MKIERIDAWICHFPFPQPFHPAWVPGLASPANSCVIYRLVTDEGLEGYTAFAAFADEAKGPVNLMRAFLIGRDPTRPAEFRPIIEAAVRVLGLRVWFMEAAIFDLAAKAAGLPLYRYLGGARDKIPAYASFGEVREPKQRADDALAALEAGFTAIKLHRRHYRRRTDRPYGTHRRARVRAAYVVRERDRPGREPARARRDPRRLPLISLRSAEFRGRNQRRHAGQADKNRAGWYGRIAAVPGARHRARLRPNRIGRHAHLTRCRHVARKRSTEW